jgi:hypothetical protein
MALFRLLQFHHVISEYILLFQIDIQPDDDIILESPINIT